MTVKEPTTELNKVLDTYRNADDSAASSVAQEVSSNSRNQLGMTNSELGEAMLEGFSATVDSVTLNDDKSKALKTKNQQFLIGDYAVLIL